MDDLAARWAMLAGSSAEATDAGADLLRRWREPHRHYHDATHLVAVLDAVDALAHEARHPDTVRLAAWFHDAVYQGRPGQDEQASAELAQAVLSSLGLPGDQVGDVARLVLLTISHAPDPDDADGAVLCDADLAVLGGSPADYAAYASAVRDDYAHVANHEFNAARAEVLTNLLGNRPLFHTTTGRRRWEDTARRNIQAELTLLRVADG